MFPWRGSRGEPLASVFYFSDRQLPRVVLDLGLIRWKALEVPKANMKQLCSASLLEVLA